MKTVWIQGASPQPLCSTISRHWIVQIVGWQRLAKDETDSRFILGNLIRMTGLWEPLIRRANEYICYSGFWLVLNEGTCQGINFETSLQSLIICQVLGHQKTGCWQSRLPKTHPRSHSFLCTLVLAQFLFWCWEEVLFCSASLFKLELLWVVDKDAIGVYLQSVSLDWLSQSGIQHLVKDELCPQSKKFHIYDVETPHYLCLLDGQNIHYSHASHPGTLLNV